MKYPEHEKMKAVRDKSEPIGEFLDNCKYTLCETVDNNFVPVGKTIEKILAEYFNIDLNKIEQEKQQMIKELQELNK